MWSWRARQIASQDKSLVQKRLTIPDIGLHETPRISSHGGVIMVSEVLRFMSLCGNRSTIGSGGHAVRT